MVSAHGLTCRSCDGTSPGGTRFCGHCGKPFADEPVIPWKQPPRARVGEQRLLTVIFCDLVGSTRLASQIEPEDLHAVVVAFREVCASTIQQLKGTVGQYLGDGLLAYFGYPLAREDDARRALTAALRIQRAIAGLNETLTVSGLELPFPMAVRIGIHSGLIVVADLGRGRNAEAAAVVGETTNVAARLQSVAAVGKILVSHATVKLTGLQFDLVDVGERALVGIERPLRVFELTGERPQATRATYRALKHASTPFFDRLNERATLGQAWWSARRGQGAAFTLEADAGMGKSRLLDEFRSTLGRAGLKAAFLTCSREDQSSSYYPLLSWIRQELKSPLEDGPEALRRALKRAFETDPHADHEIQLAVQLDCATDTERQALSHSPRQNRRNVIVAFQDFMTRRYTKGAHLVIFEDLHWADEGTLAFVRALAAGCGKGSKLIVIATTREPLQPPIGNTLKLDRLPPDDALALVRTVVSDRAVADSIVQRTDGIPLFAEELARLSTTDDGGVASVARAIPLTLLSTLSAQLDALGPAKAIAQTASALGQTFDRDVLQALVSSTEQGTVGPALERLEAARLIERVEHDTTARYAFRHALMRDAAYNSVVRTRRRTLHGRIGGLLRDTLQGAGSARPELVAQHFATAGMAFDAAEQYEVAASRAAARLTHAEAAEHCQSGLEQLGKTSDERRADLEIRLQIMLASQITVTRGNADPAVEAAFDRAREVAEQIGDERWLRRALRGLHTFHLVRGDIGQGLQISHRVKELSLSDDDPGQRIQVHRPHGLTLLYLGRFEEARRELLCAVSLYDADAHASHKFTYGSDPLVLARSHLGWVEWFLGDGERAKHECAAAVEIARAIDHPHTLAFALAFQCCLAEFDDDAPAAQRYAAELVHIAERHEYAYWLAWGRILGGWAEAMLGERAGGAANLIRGLSDYESTGAGLLVPYAHLLRAALIHQDEPENSLELQEQAHEIARRSQIGIWLQWAQYRFGNLPRIKA